jgi:lipopolysaccharide transport system ATP-binding protein
MKKAVEIRNISKKYRICHEQQSSYSTLVETLTAQGRRLMQRLRDPIGTHIPPTTTHEEFYALNDVSFDIEEGDRVGIIGRNGAGKSTLLKILCRITEPTSGSVTMRGRVSSLLEVGTGFHLELTGRENIFLSGAVLGMRRQEIIKKFDDIVAFGEVEKFLDTPVKRFSSGMYMRLGFAIAAHLDPDILIVDEVLAVGDGQFQEKCLKKLNDLSSHGRTVIFVSHDIGSVLSLCNKGIFLEKGRLKESGPIDLCISEYLRHSRQQSLSWEGAAGDDHITFTRASLEMERPGKAFFYQGEKAHLVMEYEVLQTTPDLSIGMGVWNQRNQLIARSHTSDNQDTFSLFNQKGCHRVVFPFDAALFHEGEYLIKVDCHIHNKKRVIEDQIVLKFPVYSEQKNTRFGHSSNKEGIFLGNHWRTYG